MELDGDDDAMQTRQNAANAILGHFTCSFFGTSQRELHVDLPEEGQDGEHRGLLVKAMYGTRGASAVVPARLHARA